MNLNIIPNGAIKRVHVSQNDVGRTLTFELFNNSTSYTIPSGAVVKIQGTKPSGFGFSETCTVSGNVVTVDTTEAMTDEYGYIDTELQIKYNGNTIGTSNFVLAVERNPHPSNTTDGTQITAQSLQVQIDELADSVDDIDDTVVELQSNLSELGISVDLLQQSDLLYANSNFVVTNGKAYATSITSPYNALTIGGKKITFKYRRRTNNFQLFFGVCINGHFVGNVTHNVITSVREIYGTTNNPFTDATINTSVADNVYSNNFNDYTATIENNVLELKRGDTVLQKITYGANVVIEGFAFLNYQVTYANNDTSDTDLQALTKYNNPINDTLDNLTLAVENSNLTGLSTKHRVIAGAIRNDGNGWSFIVDNDHQADLNCASVSVDSNGDIVINYASLNVKKIISFVICPDETYASNGLFVGASVGKTYSVCRVYKQSPQYVSGVITYNSTTQSFDVSSNAVGISSAVWNSSTNRLVITHNTTNNECPLISVTPFRGGGRYTISIPTWGSTTTDLVFFDPSTNATITSPSSRLEVLFTRGNATTNTVTHVNANDIANSYANFWFMGIFETN